MAAVEVDSLHQETAPDCRWERDLTASEAHRGAGAREGQVRVIWAFVQGEAAVSHSVRNLCLETDEFGSRIDVSEEDARSTKAAQFGEAKLDRPRIQLVDFIQDRREAIVGDLAEKAEGQMEVFRGYPPNLREVHCAREPGQGLSEVGRDGQADEEAHADWTRGSVLEKH